jgi:hypothetical protein
VPSVIARILRDEQSRWLLNVLMRREVMPVRELPQTRVGYRLMAPNALSAYHRMGHAADLRGEKFDLVT